MRRRNARFDAAPGGKPPFDDRPTGLCAFHHRGQYPIDHVFRKNTQIPKSVQIHFQRFGFQTPTARRVANFQSAEIRKARLGTNRRKLRKHQLDRVAGKLILPAFDVRQLISHAGTRVGGGVGSRLMAHVEIMEVRAGFEPANRSFADFPLRPLGYRTKRGIRNNPMIRSSRSPPQAGPADRERESSGEKPAGLRFAFLFDSEKRDIEGEVQETVVLGQFVPGD